MNGASSRPWSQPDPRQLPPIGAGRPFVDIIRLLRERAAEGKVEGYAELKIVRRQADDGGSGLIQRDDVLLSRWFGDDSPDPCADEIWQRLSDGTAHGVRTIRWESDRDLQAALLSEIETYVLSLPEAAGLPVEQAFEVSIGGRPCNGHIYFNPSRDAAAGDDGAGRHAEDWQILSPMRGGETGVEGLNRRLQRLFRTSARALAEPDEPRYRKISKPMGSQGILYGDKVINLANGKRKDVFPELNPAYLANGEIGVAVGKFKGKSAKYKGLPWKLEVEFSTQPGFKFGFSGRDFGVTFVVVPSPCRPL